MQEPDGLALSGVHGSGLGILRHDKASTTPFAALSPQAREIATDAGHRLIMTKANSRATLHRPSYLDYVGVKKLSDTGEVIGEYRFLGLYTHMAYTDSITRIPILRRKLTEVLAASRISAESHDGRDVAEFMETYPREELFQTSVDELADVASQVLRLRERMQTRLFLRKDIYGRYVSCLVYLSRDRYNTKVRLAVQEILRRVLNGAQIDFSAIVDETPIARLHIVVRADRGENLVDADVGGLEQAIAAAVRSWDDDLVREAVAQLGEGPGRALLAEFTDAISDTYKADVPAAAAISDLAKIQQMRESGRDISFEMWESAGYVGGVPVEHEQHALDVTALAGRTGRTGRTPRRYGGYIVHLGIVLMFVGFAGQAFRFETQGLMGPGDLLRAKDYMFRCESIDTGQKANYQYETVALSVTKDGHALTVMRPQRRFFLAEQQPLSHVALHSTLAQDLYVVMAGQDQDTGKAIIHVIINPLVQRVWIRGMIVLLRTILALIPSRIERQMADLHKARAEVAEAHHVR